MNSDLKSALAAGILIFSIIFMGGWIYESALTRTPDYLQNLNTPR